MIFLVGPHCAGKTAVAMILSQRQFLPFDLGPLLRKAHQRLCPDLSFVDWIKNSEEENGQHFTDALLAEEILRGVNDLKERKWRDIVITGNRSIKGIAHIIDAVGSYRKQKNSIVWIESPTNTLYQRYLFRAQSFISYLDFLSLLEDDTRLGLDELKKIADVRLQNIGEQKELERQIDSLIVQLGYL